jgi:non-specific riboncleoside hydrolase
MNKIPVIMDIDTGIEDACAILLAIDQANLQLIGMACVYGNGPVEESYRNTRSIAKVLNLKMPISKGSAYPMINKTLHHREVLSLKDFGTLKIDLEAEKHVLLASAMYVKLLSEATEPVTIIACGPLTNVAHVIQNHPELLPKIKAISFMGGSLSVGNITRYAEFNAYNDPEALNIVLNSQLPLIMAGLDITRSILITPKDILKKVKSPNPTQQIFIDLIDYYTEKNKHKEHLEGIQIHDSFAVMAVAQPEMFVGEMKSIKVNTSKDEVRGEMSAISETPNVFVLNSVNPKSMIKVTIDSIHHLETTL